MPQNIMLHRFGRVVQEAFGDFPYLVGSATRTKHWRDVDVRLILSDDDYVKIIGKFEKPQETNRRWAAFCLAFSLLGKQMTGLPIDFQIQQQTDANAEYPKQPRHALILSAEIFHKDEG